jgi:hypothetical protein
MKKRQSIYTIFPDLVPWHNGSFAQMLENAGKLRSRLPSFFSF